MTDDIGRLFEGLDAPRALPADVRGRLERHLLEPDVVEVLASVDEPRDLPVDLRERLEAALTGGVDARPLPLGLRRRLARSLRGRSATAARLRVAGAIAAGTLVLLASVALLNRDPSGDERTVRAATGAATTDVSRPAASGSLDAGARTQPDALSGTATAGGNNPPSPAARSAAGPATTGAPPFAFGSSAGSSGGAGSAAFAPPGNADAAPSAAPLAIAVIGGDAVEEAGFRGYVDLLNRSGGAGGHRFGIVADGAASVATANLSAQPASSSARPLLEGLAPPEARLRGDVFDVASVAERQAHIAATTAFAQPTPGAQAVIFTGGGEPFATRVPAALEDVLRARGVTTVRVPYDGGTPLLPSADAAFLSLPTALVRSWLREAGDYAPGRGVWAVYSAADESLLGDMTAAVRVASPFAFPSNDEAAALRAATGQPLSARSIHGWLTAKYLAVAVWRSGGDTAAEVAAALKTMPGYADGFGAIYEVRPATNSRTPEAVVLRPNGSTFAADGAFIRDTS